MPNIVKATLIALFLGLSAGAYLAWRVTNGDAKVKAAQTAQAVAHAQTLAAVATADSLREVSIDLLAQVERLKAPHQVAIVRTDAALESMLHARDAALRLAEDSLATAAALRLEVKGLARRLTAPDSAFRLERAAAAARIMAQTAAIDELKLVVSADQPSFRRFERELGAANKVIDALTGARPGWLHRALAGGLTAVAGAGCAGIALPLAGPLGAIGAGVGCAVVAGALIP